MPEGNLPEKRKKQMSPEAREKLSRLAKERHARGEFGGREFGKLGGRPRKDRAAKRVAEIAQDEANVKKIIEVFKDAIHPSQPMTIRLKAAEAWLGVEERESKLTLQEVSEEQKQLTREELLEKLSTRLMSGATSQIIRTQLEQENIPDAEVIEEIRDVVDEAA